MAVVVCACVVTGCSSARGTPDPAVPSTARASSPASEPASASSAVPPALPEAAAHNDFAGEREFVKHWCDLYNYAYTTGDTAPVLAISNGDMPGMRSMVTEVNRIHARGGKITGGKFECVVIVEAELDETSAANPTITIERAAGSITFADGGTEEIAAMPVNAFGMLLEWNTDRWYMYGIGTL